MLSTPLLSGEWQSDHLEQFNEIVEVVAKEIKTKKGNKLALIIHSTSNTICAHNQSGSVV